MHIFSRFLILLWSNQIKRKNVGWIKAPITRCTERPSFQENYRSFVRTQKSIMWLYRKGHLIFWERVISPCVHVAGVRPSCLMIKTHTDNDTPLTFLTRDKEWLTLTHTHTHTRLCESTKLFSNTCTSRFCFNTSFIVLSLQNYWLESIPCSQQQNTWFLLKCQPMTSNQPNYSHGPSKD